MSTQSRTVQTNFRSKGECQDSNNPSFAMCSCSYANRSKIYSSMTLQRLFCVQSRTRDLLVVVWVSHGLFGTFKAQFKASGSKRDTSGMVILTIHVCILLFMFQSRITYVPIFQSTVGLIQDCVLLIYLCACYNCLPMIREWARPADKWEDSHNCQE